MLTTFFDGEIISKRYPFLTRKWDADEEVDRKHWVSVVKVIHRVMQFTIPFFLSEQICSIQKQI